MLTRLRKQEEVHVFVLGSTLEALVRSSSGDPDGLGNQRFMFFLFKLRERGIRTHELFVL
jgi:hypothetical protein